MTTIGKPNFGKLDLATNVQATPQQNQTNRTQRGQAVLLAAGKVDVHHAESVLKTLSESGGRSGYLRLDGEAAGALSFSRRFNLNPFRSSKGEVTGQALKGLFEAKNLNTRLLDDYLMARGNKGLKLSDVARIINSTMRPDDKLAMRTEHVAHLSPTQAFAFTESTIAGMGLSTVPGERKLTKEEKDQNPGNLFDL